MHGKPVTEIQIKRLNSEDEVLMHGMLDCLATVFDEAENYSHHRPDTSYTRQLLARSDFIALAATCQNQVVGALVAYELKKFEQQRSELYVYDLGVVSAYRRQGVATQLINSLQPIAQQVGAWVIYVQADPIDQPAVALYTKLGVREDVLHFDIPVNQVPTNE